MNLIYELISDVIQELHETKHPSTFVEIEGNIYCKQKIAGIIDNKVVYIGYQVAIDKYGNKLFTQPVCSTKKLQEYVIKTKNGVLAQSVISEYHAKKLALIVQFLWRSCKKTPSACG